LFYCGFVSGMFQAALFNPWWVSEWVSEYCTSINDTHTKSSRIVIILLTLCLLYVCCTTYSFTHTLHLFFITLLGITILGIEHFILQSKKIEIFFMSKILSNRLVVLYRHFFNEQCLLDCISHWKIFSCKACWRYEREGRVMYMITGWLWQQEISLEPWVVSCWTHWQLSRWVVLFINSKTMRNNDALCNICLL
jgi:hypothetical protein